MSAGYVALTVIFFVVALAVSLVVYRYYTRVSIKTIPWPCAIWHVLSLYVCIMSFPLLVVDVDAGLSLRGMHDKGETWMRSIWVTIFALSYLCAWITLPVAQMYTEVGEFTVRGALIHSIKLNAKLYAIIIVVVVIFFGYLLILKGAYTSLTSIWKVFISLANSWGLLMLIIFMPAGLVGIPRMLWRYADAERLLRHLLYDSTDIQEDLDLASVELVAVKTELIRIDPLVSEEHRVYLAQMLERITEADRDIPLYHLAAQRIKIPPCSERHDVTLQHLENLNAKLKHSIKIVNRANYRWTSTVKMCNSLDEIIRGVKTTNNPIKKVWFTIRKYVYWTGCVICTGLTVLILWSELVLPFRGLVNFPLGVIEIIMNSSVHFVGSVVLLFYMASCAYWAAFQFKVFDIYVMYPNIADNASLCFNEVFLVRLLMPLCFNFLLISGLSDTDTGVDVQYGHVYRRNMDISVLFGNWFNQFLPILIPFLSVIVLCNFTQRLLATVGIEIHDPNDVDRPAVRQRIEDGRKLVEHELGYQLASATLPGEEHNMHVEQNELDSRPHANATHNTSDTIFGHNYTMRESCAILSSPKTTSSVTVTNSTSALRPSQHGQRYREYLEKKRANAPTHSKDDKSDLDLVERAKCS